MQTATRVRLAEVAKENALRPFHGAIDGKTSNLLPLVQHFPKWNLDEADGLWCAAFVYHCCIQAGFSIPYRPDECVSCNLAGCGGWEEFAMGDERIEYHPRNSSFVPSVGDIVLYDRVFCDCEHDHIGIIQSVTNDELTVAEGNVGHDNISSIVSRLIDDHVRAYIRIPDGYRYSK